MTKKDTLMEFPCDFPIKIVGKHHETFLLEIITLARRHFPNIDDSTIRTEASQKGTYTSITLTVYAEDQATLDKLYQDLTQHPDIKMVL